MLPVYRKWRARVQHLPAPAAEFEKWLFISVAGVLLGGKVGELLMIGRARFLLNPDARLARLHRRLHAWGFSCMVLLRGEDNDKVIVFDRQRAAKTLAKVPPWVMNELGYPEDIEVGNFLVEIRRRWQCSGRIPHEIGILLGYPLKDVLGYMGLLPLQYAGGCGWRIYGSPRLSLRRYRRFKKAKAHAIAFLEQSSAP